MRVIVCEDERFFQKSICEQIDQWIHKTHHEDVNVTLFSSSEDLLDGWQKGIDADILFLDILFHNEMNGLEIAKKIRETDSAVPIVFVTTLPSTSFPSSASFP